MNGLHTSCYNGSLGSIPQIIECVTSTPALLASQLMCVLAECMHMQAFNQPEQIRCSTLC